MSTPDPKNASSSAPASASASRPVPGGAPTTGQMAADHSESQATAQEVITALVAGGVRHVVLAPGSRSAPLAYALASAEDAGWLQLHVRADERVAGFLALGLSIGLPVGECAAVVTTSGTAVANLHPAVLEAHHSRVPLVVVSADRPHEMRYTGANQTTDQVRIFGTATRGAWDIPAGMPRPASQVRRALAAAHGAPFGAPGPVQLNIAFREPLCPPQPWEPGPMPSRQGPVPDPGRVGGEPLNLPAGERTVVVAGDRAGRRAAQLAHGGAWPLLAEPSSGVRHDAAAVPAYRLLLDDPELGGAVRRVVVLGHPTLTRPVSALLGRRDVEIIVVDSHGPWYDVAGTAGQVVADVRVAGTPDAADRSWAELWRSRGNQVAAAVRERGGEIPLVADAVWRADAPVLMLGSSSTVRDIDLVACPVASSAAAPSDASSGTSGASPRVVVANRGLAGIDGTIATATGVGLASGRGVRVVLGDLTFLHDLGALIQGDLEQEPDVQVVVLDDHGGGIFHTLEYGAVLTQDGAESAAARTFERLFGTPQSADIAALAAGTGARVRTVVPAEIARALTPPSGREVIIVPLDRRPRRALDEMGRTIAREARE